MAALIIIALILALMLAIVGLASLAAQSLLGYRGAGLIFTMASGFLGAILGIIIARALGMPSWPKIGGLPVLWTLVGAVIVVAIAKVALPRRGGGLRFMR